VAAKRGRRTRRAARVERAGRPETGVREPARGPDREQIWQVAIVFGEVRPAATSRTEIEDLVEDKIDVAAIIEERVGLWRSWRYGALVARESAVWGWMIFTSRCCRLVSFAVSKGSRDALAVGNPHRRGWSRGTRLCPPQCPRTRSRVDEDASVIALAPRSRLSAIQAVGFVSAQSVVVPTSRPCVRRTDWSGWCHRPS